MDLNTSLVANFDRHTNGWTENWMPISLLLGQYHIYPKYWNTLSTYHTYPKIWNSPFYHLLICLKYCCMHGKQCRPWSDTAFYSVWSGSTLFAKDYLSQYSGLYGNQNLHINNPNEIKPLTMCIQNFKGIPETEQNLLHRNKHVRWMDTWTSSGGV